MLEELKKVSAELLNTGRVEMVLGYRRAPDRVCAMPFFAFTEKDVDFMVRDSYCVQNLATYLKDLQGKKIAVVAKACDVESIVVLLQENQIKRENLFIIGVKCRGVIGERRSKTCGKETMEVGFDEKCRKCNHSEPAIYDFLLEDDETGQRQAVEADEYAAIRELEAKSPVERFKFWCGEFARCTRCYACRQVCPFCYCPTCVADQQMPAWFSRAADLKGNFSWNVTRAMHLAGRCTECGECERVCPVGIPLMDLNRKIAKDIKELFNYEAGASIEQKPLLASFDKNDPERFIR